MRLVPLVLASLATQFATFSYGYEVSVAGISGIFQVDQLPCAGSDPSKLGACPQADSDRGLKYGSVCKPLPNRSTLVLGCVAIDANGNSDSIAPSNGNDNANMPNNTGNNVQPTTPLPLPSTANDNTDRETKTATPPSSTTPSIVETVTPVSTTSAVTIQPIATSSSPIQPAVLIDGGSKSSSSPNAASSRSGSRGTGSSSTTPAKVVTSEGNKPSANGVSTNAANAETGSGSLFFIIAGCVVAVVAVAGVMYTNKSSNVEEQKKVVADPNCMVAATPERYLDREGMSIDEEISGCERPSLTPRDDVLLL